MAYDAASHQVVLFGGVDATNTYHSDTWTWNGSDWTKQVVTTSPPPRAYAAMAYDASVKKVILFGGNGAWNDTWAWGGHGWTQIQASNDSADCNPGGPVLVNQPCGAGYNGFPRMAYDAARAALVFYTSGWQQLETWRFEGGGWTKLNTNSCNLGSAHNDPGVRGGAFTYDPGMHGLIMFGGYACQVHFFGDGTSPETWSWNGSWSLLHPKTGPFNRAASGVAEDVRLKRLVLYGGYRPQEGVWDDTWLWDGTTWTQATSSGYVPPLYDAPMVTDANGDPFMFGGAGGDNNPTNATYEFQAHDCAAGSGFSVDDSNVINPGERKQSKAIFTITPCDSAVPVEIHWATQPGTAKAGVDYEAGSSKLDFAPHSTKSQTVTIPILGSNPTPQDKTFELALSSSDSAVTFTRAVGTATIKNVAVTSVTQDIGAAKGGDSIRIDGYGFTNARSIQFVPEGFGSNQSSATVTVPLSPAWVSDTGISLPSTPDMTQGVVASGGVKGGHAVDTDLKTDIRVVVPSSDGPFTANVVASDQYTFAVPRVTNVMPEAGSRDGDTELTIEGQYFTGATDVAYDPFAKISPSGISTPTSLPPQDSEPQSTVVDITGPKPNGDQTISLRSPSFEKAAKEMGVEPTWSIRSNAIVDVPVKGTCGLSTACEFVTSQPNSPGDNFVSVPFKVTGVQPSSGPAKGTNRTVIITGTGFGLGSDPTVDFWYTDAGGNVQTVSVPAFATSTTKILVTPPDFRQEVFARDRAGLSLNVPTDITVTETLNRALHEQVTSGITPADKYTFLGPSVTEVTPKTVKAGGDQSVTVTGHGFSGASEVEFLLFDTRLPLTGDPKKDIVAVNVASDQKLTFTTPDVSSVVATNGGSIKVDVVLLVPAEGSGSTIKSIPVASDAMTFKSG